MSTLVTSDGHNSAVKPSVKLPAVNLKVPLHSNVRIFARNEIIIHKEHVLGRGVFSKCFFGMVGPCKACVKVLKYEVSDYLYNEANLLLKCCHPNISFLLGVCLESKYKLILLSFHGNGFKSFSLHDVIVSSKNSFTLQISSLQWKQIILGIISGIYYIHHKCDIIHNDIKEDNIVLDVNDGLFKAVLIDFGKACFHGNGKKYSLSLDDVNLYKRNHPHIAPDLRDGLCFQDRLSDVYSFGRVLFLVYEKVLPVAVLEPLSKLCLKYNGVDRPTTEDLNTFLTNLVT